MRAVQTASMTLAATALIAGCGGGQSGRTREPLSAFNSCVATHPLLSASGHVVVNGRQDLVTDQLRGIVGGVQLDASHVRAEADARVMTALPVRIVRGAYVVTVNRGAGDARGAIVSCASQIAGQGSTSTASTPPAPTTTSTRAQAADASSGGACGTLPSAPTWRVSVKGASCSTALRVAALLESGKAPEHVGASLNSSYADADGWRCEGPQQGTATCQLGSASIEILIAGD